jgi:hypothetical protein
MNRGLVPIALAVALLAGSAQAASLRIFSYDPSNSDTRQAAGGLTFEFLQRILSIKVLRVRATEGEAVADLRPVGEGALGHGGLTALIGPHEPERDLYEVLRRDDGPALISAFCPGAKHAWMAFGRVRSDSDLRIQVLGDGGPGGGARLCHTLDFSFHGEWRLPPGKPMDMHLLERPRFGG